MSMVEWILLLPLAGTALGAAAVFGARCGPEITRGLRGFAAGVMIAASVWSLILPALEHSGHLGRWCFLPAAAGIWLGYWFVQRLERLFPDGERMTAAAVALHNLPEGMAVGVAAAGFLEGEMSLAAYAALSAGIALQNLPEGAIVSLPLAAGGIKKSRAFGYGVLSGIIEPAAGFLALWLASLAVPALPWMLGFAAGAMLYVAATELIPAMGKGLGIFFYMVGFLTMMALDVALG